VARKLPLDLVVMKNDSFDLSKRNSLRWQENRIHRDIPLYVVNSEKRRQCELLRQYAKKAKCSKYVYIAERAYTYAYVLVDPTICNAFSL
jgi:UDP-galactopyranose mutase